MQLRLLRFIGCALSSQPFLTSSRLTGDVASLRLPFAFSGLNERYGDLIGIGAAVTRRPLPHHRAYGSVHGGSSWLR